jgi:DHA1 family bicyclomycin/chloramphenicol resistance-like MFS transporter
VISLLCTQVTGVGQLTALRVLQGLAASGGTVVAMAVVRDQFTGAKAARLLSRLMLIIGVAPLLAPSVGGVVAAHWGWRAVFVTLALMGLVIGTVVLLFLPETLPPERRAGRGPREAFRGYAGIARDRRFVALAVVPGLGMGVVMGYVAGSSFVFQQEFSLDTTHFALVFAVIGVAQVVTAQVNAAVVPRVGPLRMLRVGLPFGAGIAAVLLVVSATGAGGMVGLVVMLWLTMASLGFISANASALAISRHGERAGSAAAVMGFLQGGLGGTIGSLTGALGGHSVAMASVMFGSLAVGVMVLAVGTPAYRRGGWLSDVAAPSLSGPTLAP